MKRFRDLEIMGPAGELRRLMTALPASLPAQWQRDSEAERRLTGIAGPEAEGFAYARSGDGRAPAAGLLLMLEGHRLRVSNIVPQESGQLSVGQYNAILEEFSGVLGTQLEHWPALELKLSDEDVAITEWVSPEAAVLLERFSILANKSTGSAHPSDFARWVAFIIRVHREGVDLYPDDLQKWLIEALGWPPEKASKLAVEYEFARAVLEAYDSDPG